MTKPTAHVYTGDSRKVLMRLPPSSAHVCCTSPPYFGLRRYSAGAAEVGAERTVTEYVNALRSVFGGADNPVGVWRALRADGLLWLNLGSSYCTAKGSMFNPGGGDAAMQGIKDRKDAGAYTLDKGNKGVWAKQGIKPGDLINIPYLVGEALRQDGWYLRSVVTWVKGISLADDYSGSCMPESAAANGTYWVRHKVKVASSELPRSKEEWCPSKDHHPGQVPHRDGSFDKPYDTKWKDCPGCEKCAAKGDKPAGWILKRGNGRPTSATEVVLMLAKSDHYYFDAESVKTQSQERGSGNKTRRMPKDCNRPDDHLGSGFPYTPNGSGRCLRNAWWLPLENTSNAVFINPGGNRDVAGKHFALMPPKLTELCILMSTSRKCCAACGAPYARMLRRSKHPTRDNAAQREHSVMRSGRTDGKTDGPEGKLDTTNTVGWLPTCECNAGKPVTAIVLDPFSGLATTGRAALMLGRSYIGLELNSNYAALSRRRLHKVLEEL